MFPAYRNMDSYPFHRNHMPTPHYYHPAMEPVPPQMTESPFPYEHPWPYAGSYAPHFCYDHNNFPGYYSQRPCYPHVPHTPAYSGGCPLYGEPFSAPYYPQSHYSMQLPRYEYDKYMPREHHCCGCSNHMCNQKEDKTVKIEEQEPNLGKKENDAMVPIQFRNIPYPLVWIPPEYYGDKQPKNPTKAEVDEHEDKVARDKKLTCADNVNADVKPAFEPRLWNGWFPFDVKGSPNVLRDGDGIRHLKKETGDNVKESENGRMDQKHQSEQQKRSEFPFPFIWLPYINKQEEDGRTNNHESNSTTERVEEVPHTFKSFPVKSSMDEGVTERTKSTDVESKDRSASDVTEKVSNQRNIPVKQIEPNHVKNDSNVSEKREINVSEENATKKDSHSSKRRSTSPPKRTKLPPVCLRVDPLPRKKNSNGSSRSPSPPASKEHSKAIACETKTTPSDNMEDKTKRSSNIQNVPPKAGEEVMPKVKTIEVSQNIPLDNMTDKAEVSSNIQNVPKTGEEVTPKVKTIEVPEYMTNENKCASTTTNEGCKKERKVLLEADAAVLIQAIYRGHLVRKWESLKKLKQIAEVSKEVTHVRDCVKAFEGSSDFQNNGKQKIAIGETIMRLLLKLDTIQGLHPSLREIRKSLARELVTLQERLDSIMADKYPPQQIQDLDAKESVKVSPMSFQNGEHNQEHEEKITTSHEDSSEIINDGKHDDRFYMEDNDGGSEPLPHVDPASIEGSAPTVLPNPSVNEDISQVVADVSLDSTSKISDKADGECKLKSEVTDLPQEVGKLDMNGLEELPVGVIDENVIGNSASEGLDSDAHAMTVLPVGVLDEDMTTSDETNTSDIGAMKELPVGVRVLDEDAAKSEETNTSDMHAMEVLPVGVLDEDVAKSEETNTSDMHAMEVLPVGLLDEDADMGANMDAMKMLPVGVLDEDRGKSVETNTADMHALKVLPVGLLDEDAATSGEINTSDMDAMKVLPVGVLDEDADTCEETNTSEIEVQAENEVLNEELPVGLVDEDAEKSEAEKSEYNTKEPQLEKSLVEEKEEVKSTEESDGWVKIELQKEDDELKVDAPMDKEESGTGNDTKLSSLESIDHGNEEACSEGKNVANTLNEKLAQQETKVDAGDMKLLEENEKLRKLMKELLEAGNEQLSVISNLTGRVKDLEKKLAKTKRSKKVRTKRHKPVTPKMHCSNSSE
ncbi:BAG family molecular chaperone regulator 6 isoform X2 [Trifolium pratense]|uniref:BAG family molecular chaperone regulator 6 isoform X2 n=1 Tax=Trifolium pratense TaxID=57577 RepID=UPI001E6901C8|nr:BAG family molecular chaperone regulator 6 isoform X2 [Trifolium pratense]